MTLPPTYSTYASGFSGTTEETETYGDRSQEATEIENAPPRYSTYASGFSGTTEETEVYGQRSGEATQATLYDDLPPLLSEQDIIHTTSTLTTVANQGLIDSVSGGGGGSSGSGGGAPDMSVTASDAYNQLQSYNQFLRRLTTAGIQQDYSLLLRERGLRDSYYDRVGQQQVEGIGLDYESRGVSLSSARARAETTALGNIEAQQGYEDFRGVQTFLNTVKSALYNDAQRQISQAEFGLGETQRLTFEQLTSERQAGVDSFLELAFPGASGGGGGDASLPAGLLPGSPAASEGGSSSPPSGGGATSVTPDQYTGPGYHNAYEDGRLVVTDRHTGEVVYRA